MHLPEIGETVTTEMALSLCRVYKLDHLEKRILANPRKYHDWKFDGCSCVPDELMGLFTGCDWHDITYGCCLPHDLKYAYGIPGDEKERARADQELYQDLIKEAKMKEWLARIFRVAVEVFGSEHFGTAFTWAFASADMEAVSAAA